MTRLNPSLVSTFIYFTDDILNELLHVKEHERPALATELFNKHHPSTPITVRQAIYIGEHYYLENGRICRLTPETNAILNS